MKVAGFRNDIEHHYCLFESGPVVPVDQTGLVPILSYRKVKYHSILILFGPLGPAGPSKNIIPKMKLEKWSSEDDRETIHPMAQWKKMTVTLTVGEENRIFESGLKSHHANIVRLTPPPFHCFLPFQKVVSWEP